MSTPTEEQSEILLPETAETTETTDQKTINNTYLTGENLTLLNKFLIPTELHSPLPDKLYRYNENLGMQQSILKIEADVSHLANICSWNIRGTLP